MQTAESRDKYHQLRVAAYCRVSTAQEEQDDILRAELVVQRDGLPSGRALFKCDVERQRCKEFTRDERENYDKIYGAKLDEQFKKNTNPDADPKKRANNSGDI